MAARTTKKRVPDPGTSCRDLVARIRKGDVPRLLLLTPPSRGEEEVWFAEQVLDAAREFGRKQDGAELLELDGGSPDFQADALDGFLAAGSLFGGERLLVLGRAGTAFAKRPELAGRLLSAAADAGGPKWMVVQLAGGGKAMGKTGAAGKQFAAAKGKHLERASFRKLYSDPPPWDPRPDASEAAKFVAQESNARGMKMGPGAPGLLVQLAGGRPADLVQGLQHFKLLGLDRIEEEDVREVAAHSAEGNAFEFAEAVLTGDGAGALKLLGRLRARGLRTWDGKRLALRDAFSLLLAVLAGERAKTEAVARGVEAGDDISTACKAAGVAAGGPIAQRMQRRVDQCDTTRLAELLGAVLRAERRVKRAGWRDPSRALEELALASYQRQRRA